MKKELVLKILISAATVATLSALTAQMMYSSGPITEKDLYLPLDEKVTTKNLKPGICVNSYFDGLDVSTIKDSQDNWKDVTFDFDDDNQVNAEGCVALNIKTKKVGDKEDGKARWEMALQKGNKGFVYLFSAWNENKKMKDALVISLLEKGNNGWTIKKSMKHEDNQIDDTNKNIIFFSNGNGVVEAEFQLDLNKLCGEKECEGGEYQTTHGLYKWKQSEDGKNTFANWNTNTNSLINILLKKVENKVKNLAKLYFGSELEESDGVNGNKTYILKENGKSIKGNWMKIS